MANEDVARYFKEKRTMTPEQQAVSFRDLSASLGTADTETLNYRAICNSAGYDVVLRNGVSREDVVASLRRLHLCPTG